MIGKPLVSIIVPVYNIEEYIFKCLNSLVTQSYEKIEIIVVDDGSTDKSGEMCDEVAKLDKRVRVLHQKNKGLSGARNAGIKAAKGEFVCLVDGDDYVQEDFVKEMVQKARGGADIIVCGYNSSIPENVTITGERATIKLLVKQENMEIVAWNKMYRRELINNFRYPEGENYEDTLTTYKILAAAKKVSYMPKTLYVYLERTGSITSKDKKEKRLIARERAAQEAVRYFADRAKLRDAAEIALLTANLAFVDFAINKEIDEKYFEKCWKFVRKNKNELMKNQFMTAKLKMYVKMITKGNGGLYRVFRKIRHE